MPRFALLFVVGCGIPNHRLLRELQPEDLVALCGESPDQSYVCDQITTHVGGSVCLAAVDVASACTATVGDWRDCDDAWRAALDADPCAGDYPAACDWIGGCTPTTP